MENSLYPYLLFATFFYTVGFATAIFVYHFFIGPNFFSRTQISYTATFNCQSDSEVTHSLLTMAMSRDNANLRADNCEANLQKSKENHADEVGINDKAHADEIVGMYLTHINKAALVKEFNSKKYETMYVHLVDVCTHHVLSEHDLMDTQQELADTKQNLRHATNTIDNMQFRMNAFMDASFQEVNSTKADVSARHGLMNFNIINLWNQYNAF